MEKRIKFLVLFFVSNFFIVQTTWASPEVDALLGLLVKKGVVTTQEAEELKGEVKKQVADKPQPVAVTSARLVKGLKLGGKVEVRYEDSQGEEGTFSASTFEPYVDAAITDKLSAMGKLLCSGSSSISVTDLWLQYKGVSVIDGSFMAGRFRWKSFGFPQDDSSRVSIDYSLLGRAFTGDRQVGVEYTRTFKEKGFLGDVNIGIGVFNGGTIGNREAGNSNKSPVLFVADRTGETALNQRKEVTFRTTVAPLKGVQIGGSALVGRLEDSERTTLNGYLGTSYTSKTKERFGADLSYKFSRVPLELKSEYIYAKTSEFGADAWSVMGILTGVAKKMDFYARYSQLNPDIDATSSSYTWDLDQTTLGAIWYFDNNKSTQLQLEYELNGEDPGLGVDEVNNNILRLEWQTKF